MNSSVRKISWPLLIVLQYSLFLYFLIKLKFNTDFPSFYWSAKYYAYGADPYRMLDKTLFTLPDLLPVNLNPPFFVQSLSAISQMDFPTAQLLWSGASILFGVLGALISFYLGSTPQYFKKYWPVFLLIYLGMFSSIIGMSMGQMNGFVVFFVLFGYYCFLRQYDYGAGVLWGLITAFKLFPALLFVFVLNERRYKLFWVMLVTLLFASFLPLIDMGSQVYYSYFQTLNGVTWYLANWNASLYGFITRVLQTGPLHQSIFTIKLIYLCISLSLFAWYVKTIYRYRLSNTSKDSATQQSFCLTIVMMLLLSPLGWQYYFSLLILPLTLIWHTLCQKESLPPKLYIAWALGIVLINFPTGISLCGTNLFYKVTYYSVYFYGLLLVVYLLCAIQGQFQKDAPANEKTVHQLAVPLEISFLLGLLATTGGFLINL